MKTINNELIRSLNPCYDPSEKNIPEDETLTVSEWVEKYRPVVPTQDIIWLLCHEELLDKRDLRLFAVWCTREILKKVENPDPRSVAACDVTERYANGEAIESELQDAADAARAAAVATDAARAVADAAYAAAVATVYAAAVADAAYAAYTTSRIVACARVDYTTDYAIDIANAARKAQLKQLMTYFR